MMARWRYLEQWKETFPFVLRSAFSFWNRVLAFGQHFVLGGKYVNDRLPMESLFTTLPRVHAPSLTKDQSDLANPSRGHRNLIKLKAAHSPRREKWQCQHRGREVSGGRGKEIFIALCTLCQRKARRTSLCHVPSWRSFKAGNAQNSENIMIQLTSVFKGRIPALSYEPVRASQCNLFSK